MYLILFTFLFVIFGCASKTIKLPPQEKIPAEIPLELRQHILQLYESGSEREKAIKSMMDMGEKAKLAIPYLVPIANSKPDTLQENRVKILAIKVLGKIGKETVPYLIPIANIKPPFSRYERASKFAAIETLGEIGDIRAVNKLIEELNSPKRFVQIYAAKALGKIGDNRAIAPLVNVLKKSDNSTTARVVAEILSNFKNSETVDLLINLLSEPIYSPKGYENSTRGEAAKALGRIGDKRAVEHLIHLFQESSWRSYANSCAMKALIELNDERAVDSYILCIRNKNLCKTDKRNAAAQCLLSLDNHKALAVKDEAQSIIDQTTPIIEESDYDLIGRLSKVVLHNRNGQEVATKTYLYHGMSSNIMYVFINTKNGHSIKISVDKHGFTDKYLCLNNKGDIVFKAGKPVVYKKTKPIKQFSRVMELNKTTTGKIKKKVRMIYPLESVLDEDCRYLW